MAATTVLTFFLVLFTYFNKCRASGPFFQGNGQLGLGPHEGTVLPLPTDLIISSMAAACESPEAAANTRAAYVATPMDVCYFYTYPEGQSPPALSTWVTQIDPSRLWTFPTPATPSLWDPAFLAGLAAAAASTQGGVCKWWLLAHPQVWVNPRVVLQAVQGVPWDVAPLVLGNFWYQMGFTSYSTAPSPTVLFSWAAMRALGGLGSGAGRCMKGALPPSCTNKPAACQSPLLWFCLLTEGGVIPVHLQNTDPSGVLSNNGVPLEPGPNYPSFYTYLTQPHQLATHFAWMENVDSSLAMWPSYQGVYGAWGLLREEGGEGRIISSSSRSRSRRGAPGTPRSAPPAATVAAAAAAVGSDECVSYATSLLGEYLDAGRTAPTSATPLSLDLVGEVTLAACGPLPLPLPSAGSLLFALAQVSPGNGCAGVDTLLQGGWGSVYAQQIFVFGPPPVATGCQGVTGDASFQGVSASEAGAQLLTAVGREVEGRGGSIADYPWVFLGGDASLVNPQALAGLTAGLHPDTPLALSFYVASPLGPTFPPTPPTSMRPMGGLLLLSRAAVALVMPLLGTPACPLAGSPQEFTPDGGALGRCLWVAGVLPVHTFSFDPLGFIQPLVDWSFCQIQVQNAFAVSNLYTYPTGGTNPLAFSLRRAYQQATYCGCGNISSACQATKS